MIIQELKEVDRAQRGQQPGSNVSRPCAASVRRVPLLLQRRGDGSRDAFSMSVPLGTTVNASLSED
jgi:hypothetical protein